MLTGENWKVDLDIETCVGNGEVPAMSPMIELPFVDLKIVYQTLKFFQKSKLYCFISDY